MIDIKVRYQAVAFLPSIEANQSNMSQMMGLFADKGFIPTSFQEMSVIALPQAQPQLQPQLRFALQLPNNEWNIRFGIDRIDISKNATDAKGNNIGNIEQFCADVSDYFSRILGKHPQKANRIGLSSSVLLKEMPEDELNSIYLKLFNPIRLYSENNPNEWNSRVVARTVKKVNSVDETFNFITDINRINGHLNLNQETIPVDRITINMDINTIPNNTRYRFGETEISDFYRNVPAWHDEIMNEILDKLQ